MINFKDMVTTNDFEKALRALIRDEIDGPAPVEEQLIVQPIDVTVEKRGKITVELDQSDLTAGTILTKLTIMGILPKRR
jgi:hypothetical protein